MNRVSIVEFGGTDDGRNVQIALSRRRRPYADVLVGKEHVKRIAVGCGMDRHSLDAHLLARADNSARYLTAIGNKNFSDLTRGHKKFQVPSSKFQAASL